MRSSTGRAALDPLLRGTSRSFWLTLRVAPRSVRRQLGAGYLFCRAADTIADTRLLPPGERLEHLGAFRAQFERDAPPDPAVLERIARRLEGPVAVPEERELLRRLGEVFDVLRGFELEDRDLLRRLVLTLTRGMETDLRTFPAEGSGEVAALPDDAALDRYCYHVAGCVGEFWTDLQARHLRAFGAQDPAPWRERGRRFGRALQMTNILRDIDRDLAIGRSYLPAERLAAAGLDVSGLRDARDRRALRPVVHALIGRTLDDYAAAREYTLALPARLATMRLACIWPLWIGYGTLERLASAGDPAAPGAVLKVSRREVRRVVRRSLLRVLSRRALGREFERREAAVRARLDRHATR